MRNLFIFAVAAIGLCVTTVAGNTASQMVSVSSVGAGPVPTWTYRTGGPLISSPAADSATVFVGGLDSNFYALDLMSGRLKWKLHTGGEIRSTPLLVADRVYFLSGDGILRALDAQSGKPVWTFATLRERKHDFADYYQSSPVIKDSMIFFGCGDGNVYALRVSDGSLIWKFQTGDVVHSTPAVDSNSVYVGSFDGYFYALDRASGTLNWKFKSVGHRYFHKGDFQGSPTLYKNLIIVGSRDYNLYALDRDSGFCHWNRAFPRGWALPSVISDTVLYVGTSDDRVLIAMDPESGSEYWRTNLKFNIFGRLAVTNGGLGWVGTLMGKLFELDLTTGAIKRVFNTDGYEKHHLEYFKPDDSFRDDIFERVKTNEAFIDVEYQLGAYYSGPTSSGDYLVAASADGTVYCFHR